MSKTARVNSVARLIAALNRERNVKANSLSKMGEVMLAEYTVKDRSLTARLRILYHAFACLRVWRPR